jgi:hypothetical protein
MMLVITVTELIGSFRARVDRLLRRGRRRVQPAALPTLPGGPIIDIADVSAVLGVEDQYRRAHGGSP